MEWSVLVIGLFVSCSCCGLQGLRNVPAKPLVEEKDILYTVQALHRAHQSLQIHMRDTRVLANVQCCVFPSLVMPDHASSAREKTRED